MGRTNRTRAGKQATSSHASAGQWLTRLAAPTVLIIVFVLITNVYNVWAGLTLFYLTRRFIASIALGVLIFGPAVLIRGRKHHWYLVGSSLVVSLLFMANFTYSRYAGGFLSASALKYYWQLTSVGGSVQTLLRPELYFLASLVLCAVVMLLLFPIPRGKLRRREKLVAVLVICLVGVVGYGYIFIKEYREQGTVSRLVGNPYNSDELVKKVGIINYSIFNTVGYLGRKKGLTPAEQAFLARNKNRYSFVQQGSSEEAKLKGKNLIFVQLESIQQFLIDKKVNGVEITPNLNRLAHGGYYFNNFHYVVGPGTSSDAEFVTFNSLFHLGDSSVYFEYPNNHYDALPQQFKDAGYATQAFHGDSKNFWNRSNIYPGFGIEAYHAIDQYQVVKTGLGWGVADEDFYAQTIEKLKSVKQPYYAHLITLSSHGPFTTPPQYHNLNLDNVGINTTQKDYIWSAHYADTALGEFVKKLEDDGTLARSALVLMGDHEGFITNQDDVAYAKFLGHPEGFNDLSYVASSKIPFIIYEPGALQPKVISVPESQLDIYPTLTNLFDVSTPPTILGKDALNNPNPIVVRRRRSSGESINLIITKDLTYVGNATSSEFAGGHCYRSSQPVAVKLCKPLYDEQVVRMRISDLVITGNALHSLR